MPNSLYNDINQNQGMNGMMSQFNSFMQNPFQFLIQRRINIPQQFMNDPRGAVQYLMQNGQMSQDQFNRLSQMANQMGAKIN